MKKVSIALFEPDIPQNTGTILRLATCFDLHVDIIEPCGFIFGGKAMKRATMDYLSEVSYKVHPDFMSFYREVLPKPQECLPVKFCKSNFSWGDFSQPNFFKHEYTVPEFSNSMFSNTKTTTDECLSIKNSVQHLFRSEPVTSKLEESALFLVNHSTIESSKQESYQAKRLILATTKATQSYSNIAFKEGDIILFGRESSGVEDYVRKLVNVEIGIRMYNGKRSLNLAVSVGIIVSEALRQLNP